VGLVTKFYCLRFESPPTWRARPPYLYPPGTGWPSYTPRHWVPFSSPPTTRRAAVAVFEPASTLAASPRYIDHTEYVSSIIVCSLVAGETCPQSWSLATAVLLSPVYTAVTWQWVYMPQYNFRKVMNLDGGRLGSRTVIYDSWKWQWWMSPGSTSYVPSTACSARKSREFPQIITNIWTEFSCKSIKYKSSEALAAAGLSYIITLVGRWPQSFPNQFWIPCTHWHVVNPCHLFLCEIWWTWDVPRRK
jgi:hypothetical protein